ncbi:MAG: GNAT family N-acetyltransferase [Thaumarchaeota archaeon]|nr:GNAT family N-acetyltransferase [Nitrososphaerota archaeon]
MIGYCSISNFERNSGYSKTVKSSVCVHKEFRRRGIGRTLMKEIIYRSKAHGYHAILSSISEENESSKRLHEQLGFEFVGRLKEIGLKFSKWQDMSYYALPL